MVQYYYVGADNQSHGPIDPTDFVSYGLNEDTMVCPVGGQQWVRLADVPGLIGYLGTQQVYQQPVQQPMQQPSYQQPYQQPMQNGLPPSSNLVWAILTTILCCVPLGIVAIVKASKVNSLWYSGQYDAARQAAKDAGKWSFIAALFGAVAFLICLMFPGILIALGI